MDTVHPWLKQRKIIHFDMDAFYAAVEIRHNPALAGKPLIVGGPPHSRAVVTTASYEARRFGIHSAMPCSRAARLCPEAIFLEPDFDKYRQASREIHEIFRRYTSRIEPISLDEAYLDVTHNPQGLYATVIARQIQETIHKELRLTGSAGVAPNKLVAKIASDINKPRGLTVVLPEQVLSFMKPMPLRKIHGIGPTTEKRLQELDLATCGDVWSRSLESLEEKLGSMGLWIYERSRGLDNRQVEVEHVRKSLGKEATFAQDILEKEQLLEALRPLCVEVSKALKKCDLRGRTITLKVKYADFTLCTRSQSLPYHSSNAGAIEDTARELLAMTAAGRRKIRLLGISVTNFAASPRQPAPDPQESE